MSKLWVKRGIAHRLGTGGVGRPPVKLAGANSFWNKKLAPDNPITTVGNYAQKFANQCRYSQTSTPVASYYSAPFQMTVNTNNFSCPLWIMPPNYPTRRVNFISSGNYRGTGVATSGSTTLTSVSSTAWTNGQRILARPNGGTVLGIQEGTTVVSGGGTSTLTLSKPATVTGTINLGYGLDDSWVVGLQGYSANVPVPLLSDLGSAWQTRYGNQLWAGGTDKACAIYSPSLDMYWDYWQFQGNESDGFTANYGGVVPNFSQSPGAMPNTWGASATSLPTACGNFYSQEMLDGVFGHMIQCAMPVTNGQFIAPATRADGFGGASAAVGGDTRDAVPEGAIFRFPANITINPSWSPFLKAFVIAIRDYGLIVTNWSGVVTFCWEDPRTSGTPFGAPTSGIPSSPPLNNDLVACPWEQLQQIVYQP